MSVVNQVVKCMYGLGRTDVVTPKGFLDLSNRAVCARLDAALSRPPRVADCVVETIARSSASNGVRPR